MRALLIIFFVLLLSGCGDVYCYLKSGEVGRALNKELRHKKSTQVEIAKLTKFTWDEFFLFGPHQSTSEVCKRLMLTAAECQSVFKIESVDEGDMLMVFRLKGRIVHTELHRRYFGDFTPAPKTPFTPQTAVFLVEGKGASNSAWLKLRPKT
ncbi:hypothetical protein R6242_20470 [Iodobacter sp. CM08]|uniref:hypothetical protein n=1 Tax=Iodobacter sp. CM08 TaxID=3085902 RepID=UPI002980FDA5|nr:hypothetical protein [Iodobacter sp. CM08]MDW5418951.1 hypothetical protein [Iodobacter sp. CM08]